MGWRSYEVEDNLSQDRLDSVICILDAFASTKFPQIGYTGRTQLEAADVVLVNKVDLVSAADSQKIEGQVGRTNAAAAVFKAVK